LSTAWHARGGDGLGQFDLALGGRRRTTSPRAPAGALHGPRPTATVRRGPSIDAPPRLHVVDVAVAVGVEQVRTPRRARRRRDRPRPTTERTHRRVHPRREMDGPAQAARRSSLAPGRAAPRETFGELARREVSEHESRRRPRLIDVSTSKRGGRSPSRPSPFCAAALEHRVLAAHVVRRHRDVERIAQRPGRTMFEVGPARGLDHHQCRPALRRWSSAGSRRAPRRGVGAGPIWYPRGRVAELRPAHSAASRKGPYNAEAYFAGVGEDRRGLRDRWSSSASRMGADLAVHHSRRRDHVGAGGGLAATRGSTRSARGWRSFVDLTRRR